jgi:hypothetical protein
MENAGIKKAVELISFENLTPEERTQAKNKEAAKVTLAKMQNIRSIEIAKRMIAAGSTDAFICDMTELSIEEVEKLRLDNELNTN